jgi:hypothetical protein
MAGKIVERLMELKRIPQPTISEIRHTFTAMINRLQEDAENISDDLVLRRALPCLVRHFQLIP